MTISSDIVEKMVLEKKYFLDNIATYDDVLIGKFLHNKGISVVSPKRMDFYNRKEWDNQKHAIPNDIFHFRVKNLEPIRLSDDIYIHSNLLRMFYS